MIENKKKYVLSVLTLCWLDRKTNRFFFLDFSFYYVYCIELIIVKYILCKIYSVYIIYVMYMYIVICIRKNYIIVYVYIYMCIIYIKLFLINLLIYF